MQARNRVGAVVGLLSAILLAVTVCAAEAQPTGPTGVEMEVLGVQPAGRSGGAMVLLRAVADKRELTIFVGASEAQAIAIPLERVNVPRPLTHDLFLSALGRLHASVKRAVIRELKEGTYFADLVLEAAGQDLVLDARPSDAIALALRVGAPIFAAEPAFAGERGGGEPAQGRTP